MLDGKEYAMLSKIHSGVNASMFQEVALNRLAEHKKLVYWVALWAGFIVLILII